MYVSGRKVDNKKSRNIKKRKNMIQYIANKHWNNENKIKISIITPTYNRENTIIRAIQSIEKQTFGEWEYIIIDDGSTDDTYAHVKKIMDKTDHPMLYIKKENGGVHTARNLGFKNARGQLVINLDSDDELVSEALSIFWNTWVKLPNKIQYREIVAQCMNENGERVGKLFPDNINILPWDKARKICYSTGKEHVACLVTKIMKENLFPEPVEVTFLTENILWRKLDQRYSAYYINEIVRIYHQDGGDHLSSSYSLAKRKTLQSCKNALWESAQYLNEWKIYKDGNSYFKEILRYNIMKSILKNEILQNEFIESCALYGNKNKILSYILWLPSVLASKIYKKKRM